MRFVPNPARLLVSQHPFQGLLRGKDASRTMNLGYTFGGTKRCTRLSTVIVERGINHTVAHTHAIAGDQVAITVLVPSYTAEIPISNLFRRIAFGNHDEKKGDGTYSTSHCYPLSRPPWGRRLRGCNPRSAHPHRHHGSNLPNQ